MTGGSVCVGARLVCCYRDMFTTTTKCSGYHRLLRKDQPPMYADVETSGRLLLDIACCSYTLLHKQVEHKQVEDEDMGLEEFKVEEFEVEEFEVEEVYGAGFEEVTIRLMPGRLDLDIFKVASIQAEELRELLLCLVRCVSGHCAHTHWALWH